MIHTKRVNRIRSSMGDVYNQRLWHAKGGYASIYFGALGGAAGYYLSGLTPCEVLPSREVLSRAGLSSYLRRAGLWVLVPAVLGYYQGIAIFGDSQEYARLIAFSKLYR